MSRDREKTSSPIPMRLREARLKMGISQKELGIRAGVDQFAASARINQYEQGKHTPDYLTVKHLASVLGVFVPYLYAEEDELAELLLALNKVPKSKLNKLTKRVRMDDW